MKVITVLCSKGGVGKTTTSAALISGLTSKGYKTVGIDLDAQRNLSMTMQADTKHKTALGVLTNQCTAIEAIQHTAQGDIIAAGKELAAIDSILTGRGRENRLKESLQPLERQYKYVIIDTPPNVGTLVLSALIASNSIIITAEADIYSRTALEDLIENIQAVQDGLNPKLTVEGILLTRYAGRANLTKYLREEFKEPAAELNTKVFNSTIRECIAVKEAHLMRESIFDYENGKSNAAIDYEAFIDELLTDNKKTKKGRG